MLDSILSHCSSSLLPDAGISFSFSCVYNSSSCSISSLTASLIFSVVTPIWMGLLRFKWKGAAVRPLFFHSRYTVPFFGYVTSYFRTFLTDPPVGMSKDHVRMPVSLLSSAPDVSIASTIRSLFVETGI